MDAQRALLDSLMGFNRDGDRPEEDVTDFRHPRVCKRWLCGLCPRELFQNTRLDTGSCPLLHLPELKVSYEKEKNTKDFGYERDLTQELSRMLADVEKKIAKGQKRLDEDASDGGDARNQVLQLTHEIQDSVKQAEKKTESGLLDESLQLLKQVEVLKTKRKELLKEGAATATAAAATNPQAVDVNQKLRVCDVCGAFLSIFDSERRLADHFGGKLHVGYLQIRKKLAEMADERKQRQKEEESPKPIEKSVEKSRASTGSTGSTQETTTV
ncbi:hypothetical protein PHYBOEH_009290 [Phytophthora boehmeriae]|uniref:Uncharacterized protein n=1 Tax=Phytophthora boehmeriae TaxID=109152 RepID=A0A8T1X126_9STRA|nr:hypothetical protein PHYBOEH_009290 [Phytophthora boehmeriae]